MKYQSLILLCCLCGLPFLSQAQRPVFKGTTVDKSDNKTLQPKAGEANRPLTPPLDAPPNPADTLTGRIVNILNSDILANFLGANGLPIKKLRGNVVLQHNRATFTCDSALISANNEVRAFGRARMRQDTLDAAGDVLHYFGNDKKADLDGNVVLVNGGSRLTSQKVNYDLNQKLATYHSGATLTNRTATLTSTHGYYYTRNKEAFFKGKVRVVDPNYIVEADTLRTNVATRVVYFIGPTNIKTNNSAIYCENGFYDTEKNYAEFDKNARFQQESKNGKGDKIRYDGAKKIAYLEGNAQFNDGNRTGTADTIQYDDMAKTAVLIGNAHFQDDKGQVVDADKITYDQATETYTTEGKTNIKNGKQTIIANQSRYDKASGTAVFTGSVKIEDEDQIVVADTIRTNQRTHESTANGNFELVNFKQNITIQSQFARYNDSTGYLVATRKPMLITKMENDSLFLVADTLRSYPTYREKDTVRTVLAYQHVRMYKTDLQGIGDSLAYTTADSIFRFYGNPVMWADTTQFSADTLHIRLANKQVDYVHLFNNAMILSSNDLQFYNQIKGRTIKAAFSDNKPQRMYVDGNAETVYYAQNVSKAYIGVNKAEASTLTMYFLDNKVQRVHFYTEPKGGFLPMRKANHEELKLKGFAWLSDPRPKGRWDLWRK